MAVIEIPRVASDYQQLSAGYHDGTITETIVKDFDQRNFNTGEPESVSKLQLRFESETDPAMADGKPAVGMIFVKIAYGDRAHLSILRQRMLGYAPEGEHQYKFDTDEEFLNKRVRVLVTQKTAKTGNVYSNLDPTSVTPLPDLAPQAPQAPQVTDQTPTAQAVQSKLDNDDDLPF